MLNRTPRIGKEIPAFCGKCKLERTHTIAAMDADGFRIMQNNGEAANQAVAHLHIHVIPHKLEEKGKFTRLKMSDDEMVRVADAIRTEIARVD